MLICTVLVIALIRASLVGALLEENAREKSYDSAERYDADGDLAIPLDAQGRPSNFIPNRTESLADQKRKNMPAKYEDDRSFCYCNYSPEFCGFKNYTCIKHLEASCFHFTEEKYNTVDKQVETVHLFGCAPLTKGSGGSYFTCKAYLVAHALPKSIACCQEGSYCNRNLTVPPYKNVSPEGVILDGMSESNSSFVTLVYLLLLCIFIIIVIGLWWKRAIIVQKLKPSFKKPSTQLVENIEAEKSPMLYDMSSGSGSGFASLNQRTVAQNLQFISVIGKGRYGEVKKALYRGDRYVAVKTFYTTEEDSWKNEKEIYQTQMLNHENILQFVAADIGSEDSITRMLLITDFHEHGSLFEYLQRGETLCVNEALCLAHSAVCGLEHLHSALRGTGTPQKPSIAHRDVKSKNIIVKRPGVCCIADFGLALSEDMMKARADINIQVGTKRYMAPEVLDKTLNVKNFHHFKMADIYSFSLVFWEILRRIQEDYSSSRISESDSGIGSSGSASGGGGNSTSKRMPGLGSSSDRRFFSDPRRDIFEQKNNSSNDAQQRIIEDSVSLKARPHVQPFDGMVDPDPSFEQMRRLVCLQGIRPVLEDSWKRDLYLKDICELINECWSTNIDCRHTALRIKRKIKDTIIKQQVGGPSNYK